MSPRKLTEDDKQEILQLYRNSEATTSTLANDYEVSSSTISRFLKNKLSSTEYEDLIQQKRLARTPRGEKSAEKSEETSTPKKTKAKDKTKTTAKTKAKSTRKKSAKTEPEPIIEEEPTVETTTQPIEAASESDSESKPAVRRRRRRSQAESKPPITETPAIEVEETEPEVEETEAEIVDKPNRLVIDRQPGGAAKATDNEPEVAASTKLILKGDIREVEEEEDDEDVDLDTLKEMLGEDLEDFNDEDEDDEEDWEDDPEEGEDFATKAASLDDIEILPLSQASLPRICYLVIDRSAELIIKPLADFADLGMIPQEEVKQRTLPVFDNHRIAKRFSHRRERVIKVPDGRMIQKTSHHLQNKGITRLLIDGRIYSLSH